MARKVSISRDEFRVYIDDVETEVPVFNLKSGEQETNLDGSLKTEMQVVCTAVELKNGGGPPGGSGTVFKLRALPLKGRLRVGTLSRGGSPEEGIDSAVKAALTGWTGLSDASGNDIDFDPELIDLLPTEELMALSNFVLKAVAPAKASAGN